MRVLRSTRKTKRKDSSVTRSGRHCRAKDSVEFASCPIKRPLMTIRRAIFRQLAMMNPWLPKDAVVCSETTRKAPLRASILKLKALIAWVDMAANEYDSRIPFRAMKTM